MPIEVDLAVLPEKILAQGVNSEVAPVKDNIKIDVKFLHLMCCPERLWPRGLVTRIVKRQVVFLSQAFYFDGVFKPSVICKKLPLPGGMPIEVDMAVLPEKKSLLRVLTLRLFLLRTTRKVHLYF